MLSNIYQIIGENEEKLGQRLVKILNSQQKFYEGILQSL